jgi:hypothetical protein
MVTLTGPANNNVAMWLGRLQVHLHRNTCRSSQQSSTVAVNDRSIPADASDRPKKAKTLMSATPDQRLGQQHTQPRRLWRLHVHLHRNTCGTASKKTAIVSLVENCCGQPQTDQHDNDKCTLMRFLHALRQQMTVAKVKNCIRKRRTRSA